MTCIAAIAQNGVVVMAGDSAGVSGWDLVRRQDPKVFTVASTGGESADHVAGEFVIGFTTSFRMGQLLRFGFNPPRRHLEQLLFDYMVTTFVDAVRDRLKVGGFAAKKDETESGGTFLVGTEGRVFEIASDYQVGESRDGVMACGCGAPYALGSLHSTADIEDPADRLHRALQAAEAYSAGVRGPFVVAALG